MQAKLKILYIGILAPEGFSTCTQRLRALEALGHDVVGLDTVPPHVQRRQASFVGRAVRKLFGPVDWAGVNRAARRAAQRERFDVLWVDAGRTIGAGTLRCFKRHSPDTLLVHYNPDDPFGGLSHDWGRFMPALPLFDVHLVPRIVNLADYRAAGARRVVQVVPFWGFSPSVHRPVEVEPAERQRLHAAVGFVGMAEEQRARSLARLAEAGVGVKIWGDGWETWKKRLNARFELAGPSQWGDPYARILSCTDISVAFLRKANRDLHTSRSIEIPACGGFMLAERSSEHAQLFEEGREAAYFGDDDELIEKVRYYLAHADERQRIAAAGHARCLAEYGNTRLMERLLSAAFAETGAPASP
ncbi:MAG: glycosyltransferase [Phycisphaerae bacterium]|nr:glycosyltransferase [Phycisphaerae bacterium]MCZ2398283.1 glycosyltransferase [Phycisphaerae bacterium]NUQ49744.1 glycosyltransferase [Phycisphaerae bacterium]